MLSKRLSAIANMVNKNSVVADIGSDHGLLPCFLVKENIVQKAYAIDNKEGPLEASIENINKYGLKNKVIPILADGLDNLGSDVTSVVIAGMGFVTIRDILNSNLTLVKRLEQVIVQSNTEISSLRQWIMDKEYLITEEIMIKDKNKYYTIISFNPRKNYDYQNKTSLISDVLLAEKNDVYLDYLNLRLNKLTKINKFKKSAEIKIEIETIKLSLKKK